MQIDPDSIQLPDNMAAVKFGNKSLFADKTMAEALTKAQADMEADKKGLRIDNLFRSTEQQKEIRARREAMPGGVAAHPAAKPGMSRHEKGLAADITNWQEAAPYLKKYGLVNPIKNDPGHFQFPGVPGAYKPKPEATPISKARNMVAGPGAPPEDTYAKNRQYIKQGVGESDYYTKLPPDQEKQFQQWVKENDVPYKPGLPASAAGNRDYDMRGFWKGLQEGDPHAKNAIDPNDGKMHYNDFWKTPYHESYSRQSKFATPDAPDWDKEDRLVDKNGKVIYDDRKKDIEIDPSTIVLPENIDPESIKLQKSPQSLIQDAKEAGAMVPKKIGDTSFPPGVRQAQPEEITPPSRGQVGEDLRPWLKGGGAGLGQILGGAGGTLLGGAASIPTAGTAAPITVPAAALAGRTAGSAVGTEIGGGLSDLIAGKPHTWSDAASNLKEGAGWNLVGEGVGPAISGVSKAFGKVVRPALAKLSGTATRSVEKGLESGTSTGMSANPVKSATMFDKALRSEITGDEIVDIAKGGLKKIRDKREVEYLSKLRRIQANPTALGQVKSGLDAELSRLSLPENYHIGISRGPNGEVISDFSQSPLDENQIANVKKAIDRITTWTDTSALGLDNLKKKLSIFVDQAKDGSPAQAMLIKLRNNLGEGLKTHVPEYAEMSKGYSEATTLIKDIESDLMMRKQGMTGRITADQTLRRLSSAMKDNFELRRDLVEELGKGAGVDLEGAIAGHSMSQIMPKGLAGHPASIMGQMYLVGHYLKPEFWPLIAASSPRAQGEFLRMFGKGMAEARKVKPALKLIGPAGVAATTEKKPEPKKEGRWREIGGDED